MNKILLPYGKVLERLLDQRSDLPRGTTRMLPPGSPPAMDDMSDGMRTKAREVLAWARGVNPNRPELGPGYRYDGGQE